MKYWSRQYALLLPAASKTASVEQIWMTLFLLIIQYLVPAQLVIFTLCSFMRKLLAIFIIAVGRSCPNVSLQTVYRLLRH